MLEETYSYDKEKVDKFYNNKVLDFTRRFFAISINDKTIGEIQDGQKAIKQGDFIVCPPTEKSAHNR